ncbi:MAG: hypothetical protein KDC44_21170 [Phaeodactylibacter sp.]|nr:hypothetical protein [Phaeodactylibacter sp.]
MSKLKFALWALTALFCYSCTKDDDSPPEGPMLNITFLLDANAARLDNLGNPATIPPGHAAQDPDFELLGLHFIGLYPDKFTPYESGVTVFSSPTTTAGGIAAIDFEQELLFSETDNQLSIPLSEVAAGTYEYFRSSIGFQKYRISYNLKGASSSPNWPTGLSDDIDVDGTVASFLGYNTYINSYTLVNQTVEVKANKLQGYFGLESVGEVAGQTFSEVTEGDAPQTTVPNPINDTSPVPAGSCVVTGKFPLALTIPEAPTEDINIQVIISINKSFEWQDGNANNKYEPLLGEQVVDMGTRGVFPSVQ